MSIRLYGTHVALLYTYMSNTIQYKLVQHRNESRIAIEFAYNKDWVVRLRKHTDARWSKTMHAWHIADTPSNRITCKIPLLDSVIDKPTAQMDTYTGKTITEHTVPKVVSKVEDINTEKDTYKHINYNKNNAHVLPKMRQQLVLLAYSNSTVRTYLNEMGLYLKHMGSRAVDMLTCDHIRLYLQYCFEKLKLSENTLHSRINALKFYYEQVLGKDKIFWQIPRPKKPLQLPKVLGESELKRLFDAAKNLKHKAILFVAYGAGLRVSEVINLRLQDIDRERQQMYIHCSKGKKDRYVRLSPLVLDVLEQYYRLSKLKPVNYIFEGLAVGQPYSVRSAQQIFSDCRRSAGIIKTLSFHSLRHSFATHTLERGVDVVYIRDILGHFDIRTTNRYLHVRKDFLINIESPIERLYGGGKWM